MENKLFNYYFDDYKSLKKEIEELKKEKYESLKCGYVKKENNHLWYIKIRNNDNYDDIESIKKFRKNIDDKDFDNLYYDNDISIIEIKSQVSIHIDNHLVSYGIFNNDDELQIINYNCTVYNTKKEAELKVLEIAETRYAKYLKLYEEKAINDNKEVEEEKEE